MNRSTFGKWARRAVWGALLAVAAIGCSPLQIIGFLGAREEKEPAQCPLTFAKDGPKKDKEEVVVLVLPHVVQNAGPTFFSIERELASELGRVLPEMAKENKDKNSRKVKVLPNAQVDKFKRENPDWKKYNAGELGQKLGADFVLDIELSNLRLYQPNTAFEKIYEGHAEVNVIVTEVTATGDGKIQDYPLSFSYPKGTIRDGSAISESAFKKEYIGHLAIEIAERHVDHKRGDGIAGGR